MKETFKVGSTYDCVVSGQIWAFTVVEVDEENEGKLWITWSTGSTGEEEDEECHSIDELLFNKVEDHKNNVAAGIIYPRGDSEEAQFNGLTELISKPRYYFGQMEVPRAFVLTDHFSPEGYRPDREYLDFVYDPESSLLRVSSPDPAADVPSWVIERFNVSAVTRVKPETGTKKVVYLLKINQV
ncbi:MULTISPECIES: hypothetical protein [Paenibacillus]|uniref:hypothetical protein n=1 Tax=Paenibacillus TaxID=44249 RepID=UPI0003F89681|nr:MULTISPECIES: hypothetical protein [Paenibacillus]KGP77321.1 hypothetical protein P364_0133580 [Paenibacillus sp. MAEPY2]KGP77816.1 hypothetical protein P363_0132935 [Paenibacillus sp. MAEPY1]OZQ58918.1 hypothetical protein CA599_31385 [Paenibacillus taichungensis]